MTGHWAGVVTGVGTVVAGIGLAGARTVGLAGTVAVVIVLVSGCSGAELIIVLILPGAHTVVISVVAVIIVVIALTGAEVVVAVVVIIVSLAGADAVVVGVTVVVVYLAGAEIVVIIFLTRIMLIVVIGCAGA